MDFDSSLDDIIRAKSRSSLASSYRPRYSPSSWSPYDTSYPRMDDRLRLSTSQLPNRRRRYRDHSDDDLIITKPVRKRSLVDPSTIVITKKVEKRSLAKKRADSPVTGSPKTSVSHSHTNIPDSPPPLIPHGEESSILQQQIQEQSAQIQELQRLLKQQQQAMSFLSDQPASCIVQFDNLDPAATSNDIRNACNAFGPVIRCQVTSEATGGKAQVEFLDHRAAVACLERFDQQIVDGRLLSARFLPARSVIAPTRSGYRTTSQVLYTD